MKKNLLILLAVPALLAVMASCNKNEPVSGATGYVETPADETGFSPILLGAEGAGLSASVETKATAVTSLSSFYASATTGSAGSESSVWNSVTFTKDGATDDYKGDKWWPNSNPSYHFYASNAEITFAAEGSTVAATSDTDVICAYMASPSYKTKNTLTFEHVFARLGDVEVSAADGYTISGVSITVTPKTGGTFNMRTGAGKTDGTGWSSLTDGTATAIANATPGTKSNDIYLVPGTYTLTASWTATRGLYTETIENKTVDVALTGGKVNKITTTLGGNAEEVVFGVSINPWGAATTDVEFPTYDPANGHAYVDLGLRSGGNKILFATMNIGASAPEEYGDYFAWGETAKRYTSISDDAITGGTFEWSNCPYHTGSTYNTGWSKYIPTGKESYTVSGTADNLLTLESSDDAASVQWGGDWRMPDADEFSMLISSSVNHAWTSNYNSTGVAGYLITGNGDYSSASLFLPAAGYCNGSERAKAGIGGNYWSRPVFAANPFLASYLLFRVDTGSVGYSGRSYGYSVRPVLVLPE